MHQPYPPVPPRAAPRPPIGRPPFGAGFAPRPMGPPPFRPSMPPPPAMPPGPRKGSAGKVVAIVVGVLVALLLLGGFAAWKLFSGVANSVGGLAQGASTRCDVLSTEDVNAVLGGTWDVVQLGGLGDLAGGVLDSRVLPDAPTCWAVDNSSGRLARIARYQGGDAAQRFSNEKAKAKGSTQDRGNGLSVSTDGYLGKDAGAGDEAFCTTGDMTASAGALVRRGDTLVYVSTSAAGEGASTVPDIKLNGSQLTFATDQANCDLAVKLVAKVR